MTDIEKKAREYADEVLKQALLMYDKDASEFLAENAYHAYLQGMKDAVGNQWRDIPTDKDGFGDADAIDSITLPIVVHYQDGYVFTVNYDWGEVAELYNDILNHPDRFKWLPITEYKPNGE